MNFTTAIKTCFNKYFDWNGRASRSEFWWWILFVLIGSGVCSALGGIIGIAALESFWSLGTVLPSIFVTSRRLHDAGRSGWWQLIALSVIGLPVLLYWYINEGNKGENAYGAPQV